MPGPRARPLAERIRERIDDDLTFDGCWLWNASVDRDGYARISAGGRTVTVTRWVLEQKLGRPLRRTEVARHTCDNPTCCRPKHLIVGSRQDNARDASERKRLVGNPHRRPFQSRPLITDEQVRAIRTRYAAGDSSRTIAPDYGISPSHVRNLAVGRFRAAAGGPITRRIVDEPEERKAA